MAAEKRFERIYKQNSFATGSEIWVDRETGVQYFWHSEGYAGGFTVLVDAEGKPLLYREQPRGPEL